MKSNRKRYWKLSTRLLFQVEQWTALVVGMACLTVFLWAALDGHEAFSTWHLSHFSTTTLVSAGWFLMIAVGLIGVTLMRFAFYKHSEPEADAKSPSGNVQMAHGGSTKNANRSTSTAASKRRR